MDIITLVGPRSVGKTTIGKELAKSIKYDFIDFDKYMNTKLKSKKGIGGYTKKYGWGNYMKKVYKNLEKLVYSLKENGKNIILDCGGGVIVSEWPESEYNARLLKKHSKIILILPYKNKKKSYELLTKREILRKHFKTWSYKKLHEKTIEDYRVRTPKMKKYANFVIYVNKNPIKKIIKDIRELIKV